MSNARHPQADAASAMSVQRIAQHDCTQKPTANTPSQSALTSEGRSRIDTPLERFIGKRSANQLAKLSIHTVSDLLLHLPFRLAHRGELMAIESVHAGDAVTVVARVLSSVLRPMHARKGFILNLMVTDGEHDLELTFFAKNSRPLKYHESQLQPGTIATFSGVISSYRGQLQLTHPEYSLIDDPSQLDPERITQPIPIYHASASAPSWKIQQAVELVLPQLTAEDVPDPLPQGFRVSHGLPTKFDALIQLHKPNDDDAWAAARRRMAYEEAFVLQTVLARRRAHTLAHVARACPPSRNGVTAAFDRQLPFRLTDGQAAVSAEISHDVSSVTPMRRLLQGDVGTGKTIVALRAMLQVIDAGGQAVLLAPTEVLARQHFETFQSLLGELGHGGQIGAPDTAIRLELLTGSQTAAQQRSALARLASGEAQLIVGTHTLLYDRVQLPNLALVVVDEQHRFGVDQRDRLAQGAHLLVMTATPIPRTIAMTSFGDLDVSTLSELPKGRAPITTVLVPASNVAWMRRVWERAREEVQQGGRVYVVCPRISADAGESQDLKEPHMSARDPIATADGIKGVAGADTAYLFTCESEGGRALAQLAHVDSVATNLEREPSLAGIGVGVVHGRLDPEAKAAAMREFASGVKPILVATTVIEVGIDVPDATMMVILNADRFGLSQLHQLRGRIGRGSRESVCLAVHDAALGTVAYERLNAFAETTDGFVLAEKDVELRSEGDVLGADQSGARSSLTFVSVLRDADIIETAKAAAHALISEDPELRSPAHSMLASAVAAIESTASAEYIDRA